MKITEFESRHNSDRERKSPFLFRLKMVWMVLTSKQIVCIGWNYPRDNDALLNVKVVYDKVNREGHWHVLSAYLDHDIGEAKMIDEFEERLSNIQNGNE